MKTEYHPIDDLLDAKCLESVTMTRKQLIAFHDRAVEHAARTASAAPEVAEGETMVTITLKALQAIIDAHMPMPELDALMAKYGLAASQPEAGARDAVIDEIAAMFKHTPNSVEWLQREHVVNCIRALRSQPAQGDSNV